MREISFETIPHYFNELFRKVSETFWISINRFNLHWWGVGFGNGIKCIGFVKIRKLPHSFIKLGNNCTFLSMHCSNLIGINHPCIISTHHRDAEIVIGDSCGFSGSTIAAYKSIKFGNKVRCGANTLITDFDWHLEDSRVGGAKEIIIGNNVWLGVNVVVLKGVKIGENAMIGANSLVVNDIPDNVIAAGNPCKVIKKINGD